MLKRSLPFFLALILLSSGCMSILLRREREPEFRGVYFPTRLESSYAYGCLFQRGYGNLWILTIPLVLDLPGTVVLDSLLLPYDCWVYATEDPVDE